MNESVKSEQDEKTSKKDERRRKMRFYSLLFRTAAVLVLLLSVVCAVVFGYTDTARLTSSLTVVTERVFELWRALLFSFVGISCGGCLWGVSTVFDILSK